MHHSYRILEQDVCMKIMEAKRKHEVSVIWIPPLAVNKFTLEQVKTNLRSRGYIVHNTCRGIKIRWEGEQNESIG